MSDVHFKGPNILITGTPGTGKTTLSQEVAQNTKLNYISITDLAKENNFYCNYDAELQSYELDEDKVIDEIDDTMKEGEFSRKTKTFCFTFFCLIDLNESNFCRRKCSRLPRL